MKENICFGGNQVSKKKEKKRCSMKRGETDMRGNSGVRYPQGARISAEKELIDANGKEGGELGPSEDQISMSRAVGPKKGCREKPKRRRRGRRRKKDPQEKIVTGGRNRYKEAFPCR